MKEDKLELALNKNNKYVIITGTIKKGQILNISKEYLPSKK